MVSEIDCGKISFLEEPRNSFLVCTPSSLHALPGVRVVASEILSPRHTSPMLVPVAARDCEVIIGMGGGRVMDVARFYGEQLNADVICIPTALTTDACLTTGIALRDGEVVRYLPSRKPQRVVIDMDLLCQAPPLLNAMGSSDVLSMLTASEDWHRDSGEAEPGCTAREEAGRICERLMDQVDAIADGSRAGVRAVLQGLKDEVQLCAQHGTDRVEEGSEHYLAYALERVANCGGSASMLPRLLHGSMVGLGILMCRRLQGLAVERLDAFFHQTGIAATWRGMDESTLAGVVLSMPEFVQRHGFPASIWNEVRLSPAEARALVREVLT